MKRSRNSLSLNPSWTLHVTRPFNIYKEGQGTPRGGRKIILGLDITRRAVYDDSLVIIIRPSLKQHVGLLPGDVSRGLKLSKSLSCAASLDSAQPLSSFHIDVLAS